jgi:hypothetical protein
MSRPTAPALSGYRWLLTSWFKTVRQPFGRDMSFWNGVRAGLEEANLVASEGVVSHRLAA